MRERLLTETVRLLATDPARRPTTQQLAAASHVSIGTVYRYFASIDAVLDELTAHSIRDISADLVAAVGLALTQEPKQAMVTVVETLTSSLERHRPILLARGTDPSSWAHVETPLVPIARVLPARLRPDLSDAALDDLVFLTMNATLTLCLRIAVHRPKHSDSSAMIDTAATMLLAALTPPATVGGE